MIHTVRRNGRARQGIRRLVYLLLSLAVSLAASSRSRAEKLHLPVGTSAAIEKVYSGDLGGGQAAAVQMESEQPEHPLGYLIEAEAIWWNIWCTSAEFKYGMTFPRHRVKLAADRHYFELAAKVTGLAEKQIAKGDSAEMEFYAGMGEALAARLYGIRGENRNTARSGVRAREHLLKALDIDPEFADAEFGLGLYNYYIDTLSSMARVLRFFMGIPGGSKKEGIRQLERAMQSGELSAAEARFYLAINLHNYDQQYERALEVIGPLVERYPTNPLFRLAQGDLYAKLGRRVEARESYRQAMGAELNDAECREHVQQLTRAALKGLGEPNPGQ